MKRSGPIVGVLAVAMLMATALPAYAAAGDFDLTFDGDGIAYADFGLGNVDPFGVAIQSNNGKIVVAGYVIGATVDFGVARLNTDGSLDPNFGTGGLTTTNFAGGSDYAFDVAIGADGRIVVAGDRYDTSSFTAQFAVARYRRGGRLDRTFSVDGKVKTTIGDSAVANAVAVQDDLKIVAAGYTEDAAGAWDFALVRYNTDGTLDTTFDGDGIVTTDFSLDDDVARDVAIQDDGRIVAAGYAVEAGDHRFAVARYNSDGSVDTTFSTDGKVTTGLTGSTYTAANAAALQSDGKIVVAGVDTTNSDFMLVRYNADGTLDTTFAGDGKKTVDLGGTSEEANSVVVQTDGRILAAGTTSFGGGNLDFALVRLETDGALDTTYGVGGQVTADLGGVDIYQDAALQSDGNLVAVGITYGITTTAFAVGRHLAA